MGKIALLSILLLGISANISLAKEEPASAGFIGLGIKFYHTMQYEKARSNFREAAAQNPTRYERRFISYALKTLEIYAPRFKEIQELNAGLRAAQPDQRAPLIERLKTAHLALGKRLLGEGGYVALIKSHFDYIASQDPVNLEARLYLGDITYSGMLYDEAIKNYRKALEIYPDNPFFQQRLGDIYVGVGNYDEAKKCYGRAIQRYARSRLSDKREKMKELKGLIGRLPTSLDDIQGLMDKREYRDVVALCKKRAAMNPSDVTAITFMGIALEALGSWQQAEGLYQTAIKRNPDYPAPYYYLGELYLQRRKDVQKALRAIGTFKEKSEALLEVDKRSREAVIAAQHTLVYIHLEILRDYKTAIRESKYLLELAPEDQAAHYNLAIAYAYLDKKSMAYGEFKKVIEINPDTRIGREARDAIETMRKYSNMRTLPYRAIEE